MPTKTYIYKINDGDELGYVGITNNMKARMGQHKSDKEWFDGKTGVTYTSVPDRHTANIIEVYLSVIR